ncbi:MAG: hypothetical protein U1D35_19035 [Paracoccaceae bacterium]|nr:hypothetical protein [Paracoccaceae bacterium]
MITRGIIGILATTGLSACVAPSQAAAPVGRAIEVPVNLNGTAYTAQIAPGPSGHAITAAGAVPTHGASITVRPTAFDQGKLAKDVAASACTKTSRAFNPTAIGTYTGDAWLFRGACA